jgi:anti-sigma factor RsiW
MCDFSGRLIAWIDGELSEGEAARVERHLENCAECRSCVETYQRASRVFAECRDAAAAAALMPGRRAAVTWVWVAAGAIAGVVLLLVIGPRQTAQRPTAVPPSESGSSGIERSLRPDAAEVLSPASATPKWLTKNQRRAEPIHRETARTSDTAEAVAERAPVVPETSMLAASAIEIAFPSNAIFPPGAVPDGVGFVADVTLAADGSAERVRLEPRLVEFERRPRQP